MIRKSSDPQFFVKGGEGGFADRQKSIFDKLNTTETEKSIRNPLNNPIIGPDESDMDYEPLMRRPRGGRKRNSAEMRQFRGEESIFKRPEGLPPRSSNKSIPDHHRNPHKWVKYTLGDVSQEDMSDRSNTAAAFSFLQEIASRKTVPDAGSESMETDEPKPQQIAFRRPKPKNNPIQGSGGVIDRRSCPIPEESKPTFRSSKLVMPEYVVGQKKKQNRKRAELFTSTDSEKSKGISLGHLMVEEEEDE